MKMAQARYPQGWLPRKRRTKKRVSGGTLPYQMIRYWEKKKYIHMMDMAKVSFAESWMAEGGTFVAPPSLARSTRKVTTPNPTYKELTTKYPPRRPLYQIGSRVMMRSNAQRERTTTYRMRKIVLRRFRLASDPGSSGPGPSAKTALVNAKATQ